MASIRNFLRPGRETLLVHIPKSRIMVGVEPVIINVYGFKLIVTLSSNFMTTFFIQPMARFNTKAGKKEFLKILTN